MTRLNRIAFVLLAFCVMAGTVLSIVAITTSNDTQDKFQKKVAQDQAVTIKARIAACGSSTALRSLLNDLGDIVVPVKGATARGDAFLARIHEYTDTNPNCTILTPAQRAEALGEK